MQDYRNLHVWQKPTNLTVATYAVSANLQKPGAWPLRDQIFRAAISISSNIAERRPRLGSGFSQVLMAFLGFL